MKNEKTNINIEEDNIEGLINIYNVASQSANLISANRVSTNAWMSAIIPLVLVAAFSLDTLTWWARILLLLTNICFCITWAININYYKNLNSAKFKAIVEIEEKLPYKFYCREYDFFKVEQGKVPFLKSGSKIDLSSALILLAINFVSIICLIFVQIMSTICV